MTKKKKRRFGFFDDFFNSDFGDEMERMQEEMQDIFERLHEGMHEEEFERFIKPGKSKVYGFSMHMGPDGKPIFKEFGDMKPSGSTKTKTQQLMSDERKPLVDVLKGKEEITVIAEVPGAEKNDIKLKIKEGKLIIDVGGKRKYFNEVKLPSEVDSKSMKHTYKNGILEVKLKIKK